MKLKNLIKGALLTGGILTNIPFKNAKAEASNNKTIIMDLAHRDIDNGIVIDNGASYKQWNEREIANSISIKTANILKEKGFKIIFTRDYDKPVTIQERIEISRINNYDFFISLHANSCENDNTGTGIEGYCVNTESLSKSIINKMINEFNLKDRGTYKSPYYTRKINNSLLFELGFLNNDFDREILLNNQDKIATIIADSIVEEYEKVGIKTMVSCNVKEDTYEEIIEMCMFDGSTVKVPVTKFKY